jgi:hypothetical protein
MGKWKDGKLKIMTGLKLNVAPVFQYSNIWTYAFFVNISEF